MVDIPSWHLAGDWFDVCKCNIPCPCTFAQAPTYGDCEGGLAWHITKGHYGDIQLDGLNLIGVGGFKGNLWAGDAKVTMGFFIDERANKSQREALLTIFAGKAGGFPGEFAKFIGEVRGPEFVPIEFEVAKDLAFWRAEIPGKVVAKAEALKGPMTPEGKRVQTFNAPGAESGLAKLRHGVKLRRTRLMRLASSLIGQAGRVTIFPLTGAALRIQST